MGYIYNAYLGLYNLLNGNAVFNVYGEDLKVYFGPPITDRARRIEVWVGATGLGADEDRAAFRQRWATMGAGGAAQRDKTLDIPGAVWVIGGEATEADMLARLQLADEVYTLIDNLVKAADLSMGTVLCGGAEIVAADPRLLQTPDGAAAVIQWIAQVSGRE